MWSTVLSHASPRRQVSDLFFPLDPGPGASIGGMCACRCSGSTAVKYGTMRDNVLSLTAVLADGTIIKTGQEHTPDTHTKHAIAHTHTHTVSLSLSCPHGRHMVR